MSNSPRCVCDLAWGCGRARVAADQGHIVVIVDTMSFSTVVAQAAFRGARIFPAATRSDAVQISRDSGAELAVRRNEVPGKGRFSLSPLTYIDASPGAKVAVFSPNGGRSTLAAQHAPVVIAGALVNSNAVARRIVEAVVNAASDVTIVACGERMGPNGEEIQCREAVEDYLGAGAILAALDLPKTEAARDCANTFQTNKRFLRDLVRLSISGQEFAESEFEKDVEFAARLNVIDIAPELHSGPNPWY